MKEKIGYARVSDNSQDLTLQIKKLKENGCTRIFSEKKTGINLNRPELEKAIGFMREGDIFVITKLDRLGRSVRDLSNLTKKMEEKGVEFIVLDDKIDTTTPGGKLYFHMLSALAEFEAAMIKSRCDEGREAAKKKGVRFGRKAKLTEKQIEGMVKNFFSGEMTKPQIGEKYGVSVATVYRIVNEAKERFGFDPRQTNLTEFVD